jgi:RNA recognition motif-containing protein
MDGTSEAESIRQKKKAAALERVAEHIAWKRVFFQARPPPPPIGQLHRRQHGKTKNHACYTAFQCAVALHQRLQESELKEVGSTSNSEVSPLTSSVKTTEDPLSLSKQEAWAAQLHGEKERRNPATDLNVRSDPTRTVIMANLHPDTAEEDLRHFADQFGRVTQVRIVRHYKTGKSRRYAFVEFGLAGEARRALQFHRQKRLKGHAIIIDRERGRTEVGFLPKRLATAEGFLAVQQKLNAATTTSSTAAAGAARDEKRSNGQPVSTASDPHHAGSEDPAVVSKGAAPSIPDDDDEFLNSILSG